MIEPPCHRHWGADLLGPHRRGLLQHGDQKGSLDAQALISSAVRRKELAFLVLLAAGLSYVLQDLIWFWQSGI
jgi:hypothetical protein